MNKFEKQKKDILEKSDKSSIGKWDKKIVLLCNLINKSLNYYTTSSCSGRIVLLKDKSKKGPGMFFFRTHNKTSFNEITKELKNSLKNLKEREQVIYKQESFILHIACNNLENANILISLAQKAGLKQSYILPISKKQERINCELKSSEIIQFPIVYNKEIVRDEDFIKNIIKRSNKNLEKTWNKIKSFEKILKEDL